MSLSTFNLESLAKTSTIEELVQFVGKLLKEVRYYTIICQNQEFNGIYRARKHNAIFGNIDNKGKENIFKTDKEFWNPPSNRIKYRGRCNDINESLFYGSNEFETALAEVRPKTNDYVTMAAF